MTDKKNPIVIDGQAFPDMEKRLHPHIAIITMKVDVRAIMPNGMFDQYIMGDQALRKYGLATKGQFIIKGHSEGDCLNKLKKVLEDIDGKTRE